MKQGKRYLIAKAYSKNYEEVECLEVSNLAYKLKWISGSITWEPKEYFIKVALYSNEYSIVEELNYKEVRQTKHEEK